MTILLFSSSQSENDCDEEQVIDSDIFNSSSDDDSELNIDVTINDVDVKIPDECHMKHVLLVGEPDTGKTTLIHQVVRYCIQKELNVLFAYATAYQAREHTIPLL